MHNAPEVPPRFRVDVQPERALVRVCPVGEVDLDTVGDVTAEIQRLCAAGFEHIVLDLRGTTFLDSTGLRLVLDAQAASSRDGWDFCVLRGPPQVQRTFEAAGMLARVRFVDDGRSPAPGRPPIPGNGRGSF